MGASLSWATSPRRGQEGQRVSSARRVATERPHVRDRRRPAWCFVRVRSQSLNPPDDRGTIVKRKGVYTSTHVCTCDGFPGTRDSRTLGTSLARGAP
eukprot:scaffold13356_cov60-Phaeocystis_antarctica.AAC.2